jgi:hypothetical protein
MLTGDIAVSNGDAYLDGFSVCKNMKAVSHVNSFPVWVYTCNTPDLGSISHLVCSVLAYSAFYAI